MKPGNKMRSKKTWSTVSYFRSFSNPNLIGIRHKNNLFIIFTHGEGMPRIKPYEKLLAEGNKNTQYLFYLAEILLFFQHQCLNFKVIQLNL